MFSRNNSLLVLVDIQERLLPKIHDHAPLLKNALALVESCKILNVPVLVTEQYPEGIGPTVAALKPALDQCAPIGKRTFSCCREPRFMQALKESGRKQIILAGIETHVCVFQTAADLVREGYAVEVVSDAVGSRTAENKTIGLARMRALGADIGSVESCLFELLETSACPEFKQVLLYLK
jgi:nicotinamidase-related amidase